MGVWPKELKPNAGISGTGTAALMVGGRVVLSTHFLNIRDVGKAAESRLGI